METELLTLTATQAVSGIRKLLKSDELYFNEIDSILEQTDEKSLDFLDKLDKMVDTQEVQYENAYCKLYNNPYVYPSSNRKDKLQEWRGNLDNLIYYLSVNHPKYVDRGKQGYLYTERHREVARQEQAEWEAAKAQKERSWWKKTMDYMISYFKRRNELN